MTSMFWMARSAWAAIKNGGPQPAVSVSVNFLQGFLRAVARLNAFFLRVLRGVGLDLLAHQFAIRFHPVGDHLPFGAVPLLEFDQARALVVHARDLDDRH